MSFQNLKNSILDFFLGPKCPSGLPHRVKWNSFKKDGDDFCFHADCIEKFTKQRFEYHTKVLLDEMTFKRTTENAIEELQQAIQELKNNNNRINMERETLYNTLQSSKQLLLDTIKGIGITETRCQQFVTWYNTTRDASVNPRQDIVTYNTCKTILDINILLNTLTEEGIQLT